MELAKQKRGAERISRDDLPKLGEFYWVKFVPDGDDDPEKRDEKKVREDLFCVSHVASNHVAFERQRGSDYRRAETSSDTVRYKFKDILTQTRPAPEWRDVLQKRMNEKQRELQNAVALIADTCRDACLVREAAESQVETLALTTQRADPKQLKASLLALKQKQFPEATKRVDLIVSDIVALQRMLVMPHSVAFDTLKGAMEKVDERLFALELYAGLLEKVKCIRKGKPAESETPITLRQMLRFMDEETLIDYDKGGADFSHLEKFDEWIAKDENLNRIAPEPRCVVAFKVRRERKDYGHADDVATCLAHMRWWKEDETTYLLLRNGTMVWRLMCEQDFEPRLIPLHDELDAQYLESEWFTPKGGKWHDREERKRQVSPDDFSYDDHTEKRRKLVMQYNRIMFLMQGLLDRSEVFHPHPPISLGDNDQLARYVRIVRDEETGLPSANPPKWEDYRDEKNRAVAVGCFVFCNVAEEESGRYTHERNRPKYGHDAAKRPKICLVSRVSRDKKTVTLRWKLGNRITVERRLDYNRPVPNKPNYYYTTPIETNHGMRYGVQRVPMEKVFAVEAYRPGDYKPFLCDAYLKGAYLKWAPALLAAEDFHRERRAKQSK